MKKKLVLFREWWEQEITEKENKANFWVYYNLYFDRHLVLHKCMYYEWFLNLLNSTL